MLITGLNTVAKRAVNVEISSTVSVFRIYDTEKSTTTYNSLRGSLRYHLASLLIAIHIRHR